MSRQQPFSQGETLIAQGDQEAIAYMIATGWVQVQQQQHGHTTILATLGPGEIVGEMGLMGLRPVRTASVVALTDGLMDVIDRTAMIRLANGSASDIAPLLASLFSRLQTLQHKQDKTAAPTTTIYATITPDNELATQALCGHSIAVTHLPWVFGAYRPPVTVSELFRPDIPADTRLPTPDPTIAPNHLSLQPCKTGTGLELDLALAGSFLLVDDEPLPKIPATTSTPLTSGSHRIVFGSQTNPYAFIIDCR